MAFDAALPKRTVNQRGSKGRVLEGQGINGAGFPSRPHGEGPMRRKYVIRWQKRAAVLEHGFTSR